MIEITSFLVFQQQHQIKLIAHATRREDNDITMMLTLHKYLKQKSQEGNPNQY